MYVQTKRTNSSIALYWFYQCWRSILSYILWIWLNHNKQTQKKHASLSYQMCSQKAEWPRYELLLEACFLETTSTMFQIPLKYHQLLDTQKSKELVVNSSSHTTLGCMSVNQLDIWEIRHILQIKAFSY